MSAHIKQGFVWRPASEGGFEVAREARLVEWLLWKLFRKEPRP